MKDLARRLCDHLLSAYGDLGLVTPSVLASALRTVDNLPTDASALHFEQWVSRYATVRVNAAPSSVAGFNYKVNGRVVIETGTGRSNEERTLTILHEFTESLRDPVNAELTERGLSPIEWKDNDSYWDKVAIEIVAPLEIFRRAATQNGCDVIDLFQPLSFEAVTIHLTEAFERDVPLFVVYAKNDSEWIRGEGYSGDSWSVASSSFTKVWLKHAYINGDEQVRVPRRGERIREGSLLDCVRRHGRAELVRATHRIGTRRLEIDVLLRPRRVAGRVAQVFAVGVEKGFGYLLTPQLQLVAPRERQAEFSQIF
jgi:hypothetical protein